MFALGEPVDRAVRLGVVDGACFVCQGGDGGGEHVRIDLIRGGGAGRGDADEGDVLRGSGELAVCVFGERGAPGEGSLRERGSPWSAGLAGVPMREQGGGVGDEYAGGEVRGVLLADGSESIEGGSGFVRVGCGGVVGVVAYSRGVGVDFGGHWVDVGDDHSKRSAWREISEGIGGGGWPIKDWGGGQ